MDAPFGVLRCSRCGCRVALESDISSVEQRKDLSVAQETVAQVSRAFNIYVDGSHAKCRRCGFSHFRHGADTTFPLQDTTLPLALNGQVIFTQTKLRILVFIEAEPELFYRTEEVEMEGEMGEKPVVEEDSLGLRALNYFAKIGQRLLPQGDVAQRNVAKVEDNLVRPGVSETIKEFIDYADMDCSQAYEWYDKGDIAELQEDGIFKETYDCVIYVKVEENRFMHWTDFGSVGTEEILVLSWLASGGNMLFGQWGLPRDADGLWGEALDMDHVISEQREGELDERQESLAELIEEGHFIGWWPSEQDPPESVCLQIKAALENRSFPQWLFKDDFPKQTFEHTERRYGARTLTLELQDPYHIVEHPAKKGPVMEFLEGIVSGAKDFLQTLTG